VQEYKNAIGYTPTDRWTTELYGEFERDGQSSVKFTHLEWENRYQLTEQGKYWLDAGIYFAYESLCGKESRQSGRKAFYYKNPRNNSRTCEFIITKKWAAESFPAQRLVFHGAAVTVLSQYIQPGFEYWIDFGEIRQQLPYQEQKHQVGPALYGRLTPHVKYDVGYLFGTSHAAPDGELKWILEYELRF